MNRTFRCRLLWPVLLACLSPALAEINFPKELLAAEKARDWATVAELASRWLGADPKQVQLHGTIAQARLTMGDAQRCEEWLKRWEKVAGKTPPLAWELRGDVAASNAQPRLALEYWQKAYRAAPSANLGAKICREGAWPEDMRGQRKEWLLAVGRQFLVLDAVDAVATEAIRQRKWKDIAALVTRLKQQPGKVYLAQAEPLEDLMADAKALGKLDGELKLKPSVLGYMKRAEMMAHAARNELALEDLDAAASLAPSAIILRMHRAETLRRMGRTNEAKATKVALKEGVVNWTEPQQQRLIELDRAATTAEGRLARGLALQSMGQPFLALEDLDEFLKERPGDEKAFLARADCLLATGQAKEAEAAYEAILAKNANHGPAHQRLAKISEDRADYASAIRHTEALANLDAANAALHQKQLETYRERTR